MSLSLANLASHRHTVRLSLEPRQTQQRYRLIILCNAVDRKKEALKQLLLSRAEYDKEGAHRGVEANHQGFKKAVKLISEYFEDKERQPEDEERQPLAFREDSKLLKNAEGLLLVRSPFYGIPFARWNLLWEVNNYPRVALVCIASLETWEAGTCTCQSQMVRW